MKNFKATWSRLQTYRVCPRKFWYRYILQARREHRSASLVFGSAIHREIECAYEARLEGRDTPDLALLANYDQYWEETIAVSPTLTYGKTEDPESLRALAVRMMSAYQAHMAADNAEVIGTEVGVGARLTPGTPPLQGRIDLIEIKGTDLILTDFKTSRSRWNDVKARESLPQLIIYAMAAMPLVPALDVKRIVPRFVIITKAKNPVVQVISPQASNADVAKLREFVSETWASIAGGTNYPRHESWQCKQCPYAKRCLGQASAT
jgi:RecB family exonuclease